MPPRSTSEGVEHRAGRSSCMPQPHGSFLTRTARLSFRRSRGAHDGHAGEIFFWATDAKLLAAENVVSGW